jgi:hypothetical protein
MLTWIFPRKISLISLCLQTSKGKYWRDCWTKTESKWTWVGWQRYWGQGRRKETTFVRGFILGKVRIYLKYNTTVVYFFKFFFLALKTTLGVTDVVYALNYFKAKISTIMKRHCCHCNGICVTFMKIDMLFYISKMLFVFRQQVILANFPILKNWLYRAILTCY